MPNVNEQLLEACQNGKLDLAKKALDEGAYINCCYLKDGNTPLHCAVQSEHPTSEIILLLLSKGANYKTRNTVGKQPHEMTCIVHYKENGANKKTLLNYIDNIEFQKDQALKNLPSHLTALTSISQLIEQQNKNIEKTLSSLQQPMDFEKMKTEFLEKENKLLQKQLELQIELEKLRRENYELKLNQNLPLAAIETQSPQNYDVKMFKNQKK